MLESGTEGEEGERKTVHRKRNGKIKRMNDKNIKERIKKGEINGYKEHMRKRQ